MPLPRLLAIALFVLVAACGGVRRAHAPPAPAAPPVPPAAPYVWTREPGVRLRGDSAETQLPYTFMRLDVVSADSAGFTVRCAFCARPTAGWVSRDDVIHDSRTRPGVAAGMDLASFLLAVRAAASARDVAALREVMAREFVHDLSGRDGMVEALGDWEREAYRRLDRLPFVLDRGVSAVPRTEVWAAPPEYATDVRFRDLRAGFVRRDGYWSWVFLTSAR